MSRLAVLALTAVVGLSTITSANAFPAMNMQNVRSSDIVHVQYYGHDNNHVWRNHGGDRRYYERRDHHGGNAGAIIGGLAAGAIIGGAIASSRNNEHASHTQYCADRYRTYRASDNSYVSNSGARQQCN